MSILSDSLLLIGRYLQKNSFGVSLAGIPFAQAVQEVSGVTQRRASLELLQKVNTKPNSSIHTADFTLHRKHSPSC